METLTQVTTGRIRSDRFAGGAFAFTAVALVLAPLLAGANIFHSYLPFLLLRAWVVGFCLYGNMLAKRAGGFRRVWQGVFVVVALSFVFVWGLNVDAWAVIDLSVAGLVAISAIFLRSEPASLNRAA